MNDAAILVRALRDPASVASLDGAGWTRLIAAARAEALVGSLACRVEGQPMPAAAARLTAEARDAAEHGGRLALWEAEMARRALASVGIDPILLKGTAYRAAGLPAADGRQIGDLDILVPRDRLQDAEAALIAAGWEPLKADAYDDAYYRRWMHELPPLIHRTRDRMIDVHHTILPPTARPTPDAAALIADAVTANGWRMLAPADMIVHAAAHLFADGDLAGGLRNLWDIDRLLRHFAAADPDFWATLHVRAQRHQLLAQVHRAGRLANDLYAMPIPPAWRVRDSGDPLYERRLLARDGWGRPTRRLARFGFYVRSHWLRMPPLMLARHLLTKMRR